MLCIFRRSIPATLSLSEDLSEKHNTLRYDERSLSRSIDHEVLQTRMFESRRSQLTILLCAS